MKMPWTKRKEILETADDMFHAVVRVSISALQQEGSFREVPTSDIEILQKTARKYLRTRYPK